MTASPSIPRRLRRNATEAEKLLWSRLRNGQIGHTFRQHIIGPYIADFACTRALLLVEVDGGQHADNERDVARDAYLREHGYRVLRVWNNDVLSNIAGVLERIAAAAEESD